MDIPDLSSYLDKQCSEKKLKEKIYALEIQLRHERCVRYYLEGYRGKDLSKISGYSLVHCKTIIEQYKKALN